MTRYFSIIIHEVIKNHSTWTWAAFPWGNTLFPHGNACCYAHGKCLIERKTFSIIDICLQLLDPVHVLYMIKAMKSICQ